MCRYHANMYLFIIFTGGPGHRAPCTARPIKILDMTPAKINIRYLLFTTIPTIGTHLPIIVHIQMWYEFFCLWFLNKDTQSINFWYLTHFLKSSPCPGSKLTQMKSSHLKMNILYFNNFISLSSMVPPFVIKPFLSESYLWNSTRMSSCNQSKWIGRVHWSI